MPERIETSWHQPSTEGIHGAGDTQSQAEQPSHVRQRFGRNVAASGKNQPVDKRTTPLSSKVLRLGTFMALSTAFVSWLLLSPLVSMPLYNSVLFQPSKSNANVHEIASLPIHDVFIKSTDGATLHAWYVVNPHATKTALISHGNGGDLVCRTVYIEMLLRAGVSVLAYDYRGYGRSSGSPSLDGIVKDAVAAHDFLTREKKTAPQNIILFGESLGTGVSCQLAEKRQVASMILVSAYTDILKLGRDRFGWLKLYPDIFFPRQTLNSLQVLSKPHPKTLIIHGEKDTLISITHAQALQSCSANIELMAIPEADHNDLMIVAPAEIFARVKQFI